MAEMVGLVGAAKEFAGTRWLAKARVAWVVACLVAMTGCGVGRAPVPPEEAEVVAAPLTALPLRDADWEAAAAVASEARDAAMAAESDNPAQVRETAQETATERASGTPVGGLSYAGLAPIENASTLDGLSTQQAFGAGVRGGPHTGASFGEGAVGSYRVLPRTFSAQYGGAAGAVIAVASQPGSARLHGSAFVLGRESAWAATNPFAMVTRYHAGAVTRALVKPEDAVLSFGAAAGSAVPAFMLPGVLKGKVKLFGSLEAQVRTNPAEAGAGSPEFLALSSMQTALLGNRGVKAAQIDTALSYLDSLMGTVSRSSSRTLGFVRADVAATQRDAVTLAWIHNRFEAAAGAGASGNSDAVVASGLASVGDSTVRIDAGTGRWLHEFSPRLSHEVRAQVARDFEFEQPRTPLAQEPAIGPGGYAPEVVISNAGSGAAEGFTFGTPSNLGRSAYPDEKRVEVTDGFTWTVGRHVLRLGGDWSRVDDRVASVNNADGTFEYDSGVTGGHAGGLVDWITDFTFNVHAYPNGACPSINASVHYFCFRTYTQSFGVQQTEFVTHEIAGYAEDTWSVRDGLSVSAGARYEYTLLPLPQSPNVALDAALTALAARGTTGAFPEDRNNAGPRVGVSWATRFFALHAGYGVFFGRLPGATIRAALANTALPSSVTQVRITPTTEALCPQVTGVNQGFGYACDFLGAPPAAVAQTTQVTVFAKDLRLPAVQRATLSLERTLGRHVELRAGYAGAIATQLPGSVDVNVAAATSRGTFQIVGGAGYRGLQPGATFSVPVYTHRLLSGYGPVSAVTSNANATYHALNAELRVRWGGFDVQGSYTFSRAIDYGPQLSATPAISTQFDPFADGYDKARSSLDFTHRFAGDLVWRAAGARWWSRGWRVSAIGSVGSGAPYSYGVFGGTRLSGGHETMNGSGGATYLPTVGRNTLRLPVRANADVRVGRELELGRFRLTAYAEAFNVLNTRSLTRVESRAFLVGTAVSGVTPLVFQDAATVAAEGVGTPAFGAATSSTSGLTRERQVELGLRATF